MRVKQLVMNTALNVFGMYAVISGNEFAGNIFFAATIILFVLGIIVVLGICIDPEHCLPQDTRQKLRHGKLEKGLHLATDIPLILVLFGSGWWFSGFAFFFIHIIVSVMLKVKLDELEKEIGE